MSKVSCVSSGKATESPLRMARAELLWLYEERDMFPLFFALLDILSKYSQCSILDGKPDFMDSV